MEDISQYIVDTIMEKPYVFSVDFVEYDKNNNPIKKNRNFCLRHATLGKMLLLQRLISGLGICMKNLEANPSIEALRLVNQKREACLLIITYAVCETKKDLFDKHFVDEQKDFFDKNLTEEEITALLLVVLNQDKSNLFIHHLGIDKEQNRLSAVVNAKNQGGKNNVTFGGLSQFGTLLDAACERYGWTKEYVVWGIDYSSLRLMLADKVTSVYLSDDELKRVPRWALTDSKSVIRADDPKNRDLIKNMNWR